jgi:hypothetical protein
LTTVKPATAEVIELGNTRLAMPPRPLSLEEKTARFFQKSGKLAQRIGKAQEEARSHYLRVLLIVGDPTEKTSCMFQSMRTEDSTVLKALLDYEQVAVAVNDADSITFLRQSCGLKVDPRSALTLVVLGDDGKVSASYRPLLEKKDTSVAAKELAGFLTAHALPRLDAEKLLAAALERARRQDKRVFIQETGTYCSWCRVLSRFIASNRQIFDENYVMLEIDRDRFVHGDEVMKRYRSGDDRSIPWCAVLDAEAKMHANWNGPNGNIGFPNDAKGIDHFLQVLTKTAARLTPGQLQELRRALEKDRVGGSQKGHRG